MMAPARARAIAEYVMLDSVEQEVRAALLAYAAMVERCEEVIADVNGPNSRFDHGIATPDFDANEIVEYILKGATDG